MLQTHLTSARCRTSKAAQSLPPHERGVCAKAHAQVAITTITIPPFIMVLGPGTNNDDNNNTHKIHSHVTRREEEKHI